VLPQDADLVLDHFGVAEAAPDLGVLGDKPQRLLLATEIRPAVFSTRSATRTATPS
jgi:hypothetical protein